MGNALNPRFLPHRLGFTSFIDLTYTAFIVALSLAFNNTDSFSLGFLGVCDVIGNIVYVIDLILGFQMGVIAKWERRAIVVLGKWHCLCMLGSGLRWIALGLASRKIGSTAA